MLAVGFFLSCLKNLGTERHLKVILILFKKKQKNVDFYNQYLVFGKGKNPSNIRLLCFN